jgi:hypothetical protein
MVSGAHACSTLERLYLLIRSIFVCRSCLLIRLLGKSTERKKSKINKESGGRILSFCL